MAKASKPKKKRRPKSKKKSLKRNQHPLFSALFFLLAVCSLIAALYLNAKYNNHNIRPHKIPVSRLDKPSSPQIKSLKSAPATSKQQSSGSRISQPTTLNYYRLELNFNQAKRLRKKFNQTLNSQQKAFEIIHLLSFTRDDDLAPLPHNTRLLIADFTHPTITIDVTRDLSRGAVNFGGRDEMLAISCLTNSFLLNFPNFESLQVLIEGKKRETLAGHIDISQPLHYQPSIDR